MYNRIIDFLKKQQYLSEPNKFMDVEFQYAIDSLVGFDTISKIVDEDNHDLHIKRTDGKWNVSIDYMNIYGESLKLDEAIRICTDKYNKIW